MLWAMAHTFRHLFTPLRVGGLTLKNRIFSTGHAEAMAEDGKPGPRLRAYHEAKARGGAGLTIVGGSTSVHPSSPASAWNMIANHDDSVIPGYRSLADAVHRHGCRVMSQLTHMGRRSQSDVESWHVLLAPSQIPEKVHREVPHEIEPEQIAMLVRAFGDATGGASRTGCASASRSCERSGARSGATGWSARASLATR
jgi:2,4-dienoyl-CoA reductase-like NADH-dependent reductase (Old Yellow Enzyme family)